MTLMQGKKGIIFGVSNKRGIAYAIAQKLYENGAEIAFTYANEAMKEQRAELDLLSMSIPALMRSTAYLRLAT